MGSFTKAHPSSPVAGNGSDSASAAMLPLPPACIRAADPVRPPSRDHVERHLASKSAPDPLLSPGDAEIYLRIADTSDGN